MASSSSSAGARGRRRCTVGVASDLGSGVPSAIRRPKSRTVTRSAMPITIPMSCSTRSDGDAEAVADLERSARAIALGLVGVHAGHRLVEQQQVAARCTARGPPRRASGRRRTASPTGASSLLAELEELGDLPARVPRAGAPRAGAVGSRSPAATNPARVRRWRPSIRFSATVWAADSAMFWKVRATPSAAIRCGRSPVSVGRRRSAPRRPPAGRRPDSTLNSVDLPAPFGPMTACTVPGCDGERHVGERRDAPPKRTVDGRRRLRSASVALIATTSSAPRPGGVVGRLRSTRLGAVARGRGRCTASSAASSAAGPDSDTSPTSSTKAWSATRAPSPRSARRAGPTVPWRLISRMTSPIWPTTAGASPRDGSSSSSSRGLAISARPIASICCSPPDSRPARWARRSRRTREQLVDARSSRAARRRRRARAKPPARRFSSTVSRAKMRRPSGTWTSPLATIAAAATPVERAARRTRSSPRSTRRDARRSVPDMARSSVVLPAPLLPSTATTAAGRHVERHVAQRADRPVRSSPGAPVRSASASGVLLRVRVWPESVPRRSAGTR